MKKHKKDPDKIINNDFPSDRLLYSSVKNLVSKIIKKVKTNDTDIRTQLLYAISTTNKIVIHTYNFLKLYILHLHSKKIDFPLIDANFIRIIMLVVSVKEKNSGGKMKNETIQIYNKLKIFFNSHYMKTISKCDVQFSDSISQILTYESEDILKNIQTNIKEHYVNHVK